MSWGHPPQEEKQKQQVVVNIFLCVEQIKEIDTG